MSENPTKEDIWDAVVKHFYRIGVDRCDNPQNVAESLFENQEVEFANTENVLLYNYWIEHKDRNGKGSQFKISKLGMKLHDEYGSYSAWKLKQEKVTNQEIELQKLQVRNLELGEKLQKIQIEAGGNEKKYRKMKRIWSVISFFIGVGITTLIAYLTN